MLFNSLATRMALILALTLVAAQIANTYVFSEQKRLALVRETSDDALERMVEAVESPEVFPQGPHFGELGPPPGRPPRHGPPPRGHERRPKPDGRPMPLRREGVIWRNDKPIVMTDVRGVDPDLKNRLVERLKAEGYTVADARGVYVPSPHRSDRRGPPPEGLQRERRLNKRAPPPHEVRFSIQLAEPIGWLNGRFPAKPPPPRTTLSDYTLGGGVFVFFAVIAAGLIAFSISRPLGMLSSAARDIGRQNSITALPVRGPSEIRETLQAFNDMNARVSELLKEKDLMLGALGHDLRTPLTSLRLRIEHMTPHETRLQAIQTIDETSKLIEDILELARSNGRETKLKIYNITALLDDVVADYREFGAAVTFDDTPKMIARCNPTALQRLLRNLIDNALKYAGSAHILLSMEQDRLRLSVEDDGPGIADDSLATVMDPFQRGDDSRSRSSGGAGLGLAIARAIAQMHGGHLVLENRRPTGLRASVVLPIEPHT